MSLVQGAVDMTTRVLTRARKNKRITPAQHPVKVNLGSGIEGAPGWINIDAGLHALAAGLPVPLVRLAYRFSGSRHAYDERDYVARLKNQSFVLHDLTTGIPLDDDVVDFAYVGFFLEVLLREDAARFVEEIVRVLKPAGILRVAGMDMQAYIAMYQQGKKDRAIRSLFGTGPYTLLNQRRYVYDEESLTNLLMDAGFSVVQRRRFRDGAVPDLELIEKFRDPMLVVEASRADA